MGESLDIAGFIGLLGVRGKPLTFGLK